jgi:hypothetical protein
MKLKMFPLPSQYILSCLPFVFKNKKRCTDNSVLYHIDPRQRLNLHKPLPNLTKYQKCVYYLDIKVFNVCFLLMSNKSPTDFNLF